MTLQRFRMLTARTDEADLRQAITVALMADVPRSAASYQHFYARVVEELQRPKASPAAHTPELVSCV
jgi:hypothetical protein